MFLPRGEGCVGWEADGALGRLWSGRGEEYGSAEGYENTERLKGGVCNMFGRLGKEICNVC